MDDHRVRGLSRGNFPIRLERSSGRSSHFFLRVSCISPQMRQKFDALEQRVANLESVPYQNSNSITNTELMITMHTCVKSI
ncbi:hypothetical protein F8388_013710 [Cannabis sativa]|uniref:Uncharacterized protein n=1 Tax=Cannabis sativa TaxID=3483 RepID=A0A7J6HSS8_CANSA|nr:hypothetical protein F8388_013710 [Cannabis sativa]KAF4398327.1 hypothetical protein G4B88_007606 [Cannabis sativa]